jgi:hypothetical protein
MKFVLTLKYVSGANAPITAHRVSDQVFASDSIFLVTWNVLAEFTTWHLLRGKLMLVMSPFLDLGVSRISIQLLLLLLSQYLHFTYLFMKV